MAAAGTVRRPELQQDVGASGDAATLRPRVVSKSPLLVAGGHERGERKEKEEEEEEEIFTIATRYRLSVGYLYPLGSFQEVRERRTNITIPLPMFFSFLELLQLDGLFGLQETRRYDTDKVGMAMLCT